ncbi:hypothetical protein D3C73_1048890 [compost metagenome]
MNVMENAPLISVTDHVRPAPAIFVYGNLPVLKVDLEEKKAQPGEEELFATRLLETSADLFVGTQKQLRDGSLDLIAEQ